MYVMPRYEYAFWGGGELITCLFCNTDDNINMRFNDMIYFYAAQINYTLYNQSLTGSGQDNSK